MSLFDEAIKEVTTGVRYADTPEDLSVLHDPSCAAAILRRQPMPGFLSWIDTLEPERLPKARAMLRPEHVRESVVQICNESRTPECSEREWLIDDVTHLARIFAGLMDARYLRLRFDVVATNACRKFHCDFVTARLICTYRGTGTQYGFAADGTEPRQIFTLPAYAPILLRGRHWPEFPPSGLLHRSPPIEGTGETRLVLVLDPVSGPTDGC